MRSVIKMRDFSRMIILLAKTPHVRQLSGVFELSANRVPVLVVERLAGRHLAEQLQAADFLLLFSTVRAICPC